MHTVEEFLALDRLTLETQTEHGGKELSADQLRRRFEEALPVSQVCTVRRDGMLVAYAMLQPQSETCWFVTCFNTHPFYRTSPVLLELFSAFGALVQRFGITELRSNVYKTNHLSLSFHKRLGFRVTRENTEAVEMFTTVAEMTVNSPIVRTFKRHAQHEGTPVSTLGLNHYNLRAHRELMETLRAFYCDVVGLTVGQRPAFASFGYWLYAGESAVLHLSEAAPGETRSTEGTTTFDHVAFSCTNRAAFEQRLSQKGIAYELAYVPHTSQAQLFFKDPANNGVELNFAPAEDA